MASTFSVWLSVLTICCSLLRLGLALSAHTRDLEKLVADHIETVGGCKLDDDKILRPNLIFILLDSLGMGDLSVTTGQWPTPNMDALYRNSVRLNRHYVHLMGSASRTQFLTGRYAMNLGFGQFAPWSESEIGGIPMGQPSIANWLSQFGDYTTYGLGQWQLGYANRRLLPLENGFHHFYGSLSDAVAHSVPSTDLDINSPDTNHDHTVYDLYDDGEAQYEAVESSENTQNTLALYSRKMTEWIESEGAKRREALEQQTRIQPFYLYAALPTMTGSVSSDGDEYSARCNALSADQLVDDGDHDINALSYCSSLLRTDAVIGELMDSLRANDLYKDSVIVFTAANGGVLSDGASNYPLRGDRGQLFDGNGRVLATVSGGILERKGLFDAVRDDVVSNLDWTPTLLQFAGYLNCIRPEDVTWDGQSQYDLIWGSGSSSDSESISTVPTVSSRREHLVLNIGDADHRSAAVLMEHDGVLYKYLSVNPDADPSASTDGWSAPSEDGSAVTDYDKWSVIDPETHTLSVMEHDDGNALTRYSQRVDGQYLFALSRDEGEFYNVLDPLAPGFDAKLNGQLIHKIDKILEQFLADNVLWSEPINALHNKMIDDGDADSDSLPFLKPFLSDKEYKVAINRMFQSEEKRGHLHSEQQQALYLSPWSCPDPLDNELVAKRVDIGPKTPEPPDLESGAGGSLKWWMVLIIVGVSVVIMVAIAVTIIMYHCNHEYEVIKRRICGLFWRDKDAEYQPIKDHIVCIADIEGNQPSI